MSPAAPIAQIEPLTTARVLRGPFDYRLPEALDEKVSVGSILRVPFGRRELLGVVVGLADESDLPEEKLLAPSDVLSAHLPADLVRLAHWMAREYCSTPARALGLMLPAGTARGAGPRERLVVDLTADGRRALEDRRAAASRDDGAGARGRVGPRLSERQLALLAMLTDGPVPASRLHGGHGAARRLEGRGLVRVERREFARRPQHLAVGSRSAEPLPLTGDQERAFAAISAALETGAMREMLLHGVTGSGKTEVYLRAAAAALERGRGVIVLVPEIALTPQMVGRFAERLGDTVAVLHSRLGPGERYDEWHRLRSGAARVCVGPRSAVFAPVEDLGLIVVDEEHESSYKHEGDPRYDARVLAAERARMSGAVLLAGSATPRPETYESAEHLRLPRRVDDRPLPHVEVLDMCSVGALLHPRAVEALAEVRHRRSKAIILLNRRGWSAFLSCARCGHVWGCPQCDVTLVMHRHRAQLSCHHCGHWQPVPERCECGSRSLARHGAGTERLEQSLLDIVGDAAFPVFRLDGDVAASVSAWPDGRGCGATASLLRAFEQAPCGVLLGTQMVAKGHDFPGVSLGLVLDADATLGFPDFRAEERTFSLIAQLAGRVGRGGEGRVLVQTLAPAARAIAHGAAHDSEGFLGGEIERRRALAYPPFADLIRITCSAEQAQAAAGAARALRERLDAALERQLGMPDDCDAPGVAGGALGAGHTTVLGPAALFRLRGRERRALLLKTTARASAVRAVDLAVQATAACPEHAPVNFSVDVDPH